MESRAHKQARCLDEGFSSLIQFLICLCWSQFAFHQYVATDDGVTACFRLKVSTYLPSTYRVQAPKTVCSGPSSMVKESESESCSVVSDSLQSHGLSSPRTSPGQNTGVGSLSLLQGIFPTQGLGLPCCRLILCQPSYGDGGVRWPSPGYPRSASAPSRGLQPLPRHLAALCRCLHPSGSWAPSTGRPRSGLFRQQSRGPDTKEHPERIKIMGA